MSQFSEGQSGNPSGRPKGIKDRRILFAEMLGEHKQALFDKAIELALSGNEQMLRLLLDRLLPAKPKDDYLPEIDLSGSISEQASKIIGAISDGIVTPAEADQLLEIIVKRMRILETDELAKKLDVLWRERDIARNSNFNSCSFVK